MVLRGSTILRRKDTAPLPAAEICANALEDLTSALATFGEWRVTELTNGRTQHALAELKSTAMRGAFPAKVEERRLVVNALNLANDFADIAKFLTAPLEPMTYKTLKKAMRGTLSQRETQRGPYQAQSELWQLAVLARGGLSPFALPVKEGRLLPDYGVELGSITYGIEVKRPQNRSNCVNNLRRARNQLRDYGVKGAAVLDLTDCFNADDPLTNYEAFGELETEIFRTVWDRGYRSGFGGVMVVATVARGIEVGHGDPSLLSIVNYSGTMLYSAQMGSLHFIHGEHLQEGLANGLAAIGFTPDEPQSGWDRSMDDSGPWREIESESASRARMFGIE
jgi:hypothetical protein